MSFNYCRREAASDAQDALLILRTRAIAGVRLRSTASDSITSMGLAHTARTVRNLVRSSWEYRRAYATPLDAYKGFLMRTAIGRKGKAFLSKREIKINVPDSSEPVFLRRATCQISRSS